MIVKSLRVTSLFIALLVASASMAVTDTKQDDMSAADFSAQKALFVKQLNDGNTYAEITPDNRNTVNTLLDRMEARIQRAGSVQALGAEEKVDFYNDQEQVNAILTKAKEDSRVICKREMEVGSHHIINHCTTLAQQRKDREDARRVLDQVQINSQNVPSKP